MKNPRKPKTGPRLVGVRDAKAQFSRLLHEVQAGAEWTITERGRPIARLVPIALGTTSLADRIRQLEDDGTLEPENANRAPLPAPLPVPGALARTFLERDRDVLA